MLILPCTPSHSVPSGQVTLLGAITSVTGAMTLVEMGGARLLVDCGVAQGREAETWRFPKTSLQKLDAVILTHGHNDHVGSLPALIESGFSGRIYGTRATLDLARLVIEDGLRLQRASSRDTQAFLTAFDKQRTQVPYNEAFVPDGFKGSVNMQEAGHILGSCSVELHTSDGRVICSGDLGRPNSPILRDFNKQWNTSRPVDLVVMESTYGDDEHNMTHEDVEARLETIVNRAVADGGHILVPAFAIGRTQTLIYHLNTLIEAKRIPDIGVAIDSPLGLRVTELYQRGRSLFDKEALDKFQQGDNPLDFNTLYAVNRAADSARLRDVKEPLLIIAGSGMCTGGRIVGHLKDLLPLPQTCVVFVGFQAPGTPGAAIQAAKRTRDTVWLDHEAVPVNAHIESLSGLSAHADRKELWQWLSAIPHVKRVALHHGEIKAQESFAAWAARRL
ncbi:MAG: MBL fold metallo-hydrolase [Deltaproteobacteria bacterium]|nr:MBL fold metallo-hydrolase [Deltaproteobacteria bacterium]